MGAQAPAAPVSGDVSRAYDVTIPTVVTVVIAFFMTVLRLYTRVYIIKFVGWDDFFNVMALATSLVVTGLILTAAYYGLGRHLEYVDDKRAAYSVMLLRICEFQLIITTIFVKISISLFLKRLFLTSQPWRIFFWAFIAFNTITSMADAIAIFPQCRPVQFNWNKSIHGKCWSNSAINTLGIAQGTIAGSTDITLSVLPLVFLWNLQVKRHVKYGICAIMALGFASGGFAIARTLLVPSLTATQDPTWDLVPLFKWATLEATFGVIAAAAPAVRPLFGRNAAKSSHPNSKSKSKSSSVPLQPVRSHLSSQQSWHQSQPDHSGRSDGSGEEPILEAGHSGTNLWPKDTDAFVRMSQIRIVHSPTKYDERPRAMEREDDTRWDSDE